MTEIENDLLAVAVEHVTDSVIITDREGRIGYANPAFERASGYAAAEIIGQQPRLLENGQRSKRPHSEIWDALSKGTSWNGRLVNKRKDGAAYEEDVSISPVLNSRREVTHFVWVNRIVSDENRLREQLWHAQKLEAIARMTCGIVHDLNNLLTGILNCADFLSAALDDDAPQLTDVRRIQECGRRATLLTRRILGFSREQAITPVVVDLSDTLCETTALFRLMASDNIEVAVLTDAVGLVRIDPVRLQLALLNLALNAKDAMPEGGTLSFELTDSPDPNCVLLTVQDTGVGMAAEILDQVFRPFFTTKPKDRGTGLGLAAVREIVIEAGGSIRVSSELHKGTAFEIELPRAAPITAVQPGIRLAR